MHKLKLFVLFFVAIILTLLVGVSVSAVSVSDPPVSTVYAPVFVTGFSLSGTQLDAIELYNEWPYQPNRHRSLPQQSSHQATTNPRVLFYIFGLGSVTSILLTTQTSQLGLASNPNVAQYGTCYRAGSGSFSFSLNNTGVGQDTIMPLDKNGVPVFGSYVRRGLTKTYRKGEFVSDFTAINRSLYAGLRYYPPELSQLQISEILINSRNCSPLESSLDCGDYVKLYNPTGEPIDLSNYRIRNGYTGQTPSSSNTFVLDGVLESGHFMVIPMSTLNSASWLWIEDTYGVKRYDNTVTEYPDGGSDTKKGQAWAYDESDGIWKWTKQPTPIDSPSVFPPEPIKLATVVATTYAPCAEGQYRSEETHRCRSIVSEVVSLIPCSPGQERNPETNRCRSVSAVLGANDLKPCGPGQERNPETNRCRNVSGVIPQSTYAPKQSTKKTNNYVMWASLGVVAVIAVVYAIWEWRYEVRRFTQSLATFVKRPR